MLAAGWTATRKHVACMFTVGNPFSSLKTGTTYKPVKITANPLPGCYGIEVIRVDQSRGRKQIKVIAQSGPEWMFTE
jgi:hypothetical protein